MISITHLEKTCPACPAQWEGKTYHGHTIYIRYRWGYLSVRMSPEPTEDFDKAISGEEIFGYQNEDSFDGFMSYKDLKEIISKFTKIELPESDGSHEECLFL